MSSPRLGAATDWVARIALVLVVAVVGASCSGGDDAESGPTSSTGSTTSTIAEDEGVKLFDASVVHSISIDFDQADYDDMLETFSESNEKAWIEATVTIDGVTYERAGLRLKGNSSLMASGEVNPAGQVGVCRAELGRGVRRACRG